MDDEEIETLVTRIVALLLASSIVSSGMGGTSATIVVGRAKKFEHYLRTGDDAP